MTITVPSPVVTRRGYLAGVVIAPSEPVVPSAPVLGTPLSLSTVSVRVPIASFPPTAETVDVEYSPAGAGTWSTFEAGITRAVGYAQREDLTVATSYDFRPRATNVAGNSSYGSTVTGATVTPGSAPLAPSAFVLTPEEGGTFAASWQDNSTNETSFKIQHWDGDDWDSTVVATPAAGETSATGISLPFVESNGQAGARIRASNSFGDSDPSNEDWKAPDESSGGAPTAAVISVTSPSTTSLQVQLVTPSDGATSRQLYISSIGPSDPDSWTTVSGADSDGDFPVTIGSLSSGNNRWFDYRCTNGDGTTSSNIVQGTVQTASSGALFFDGFESGSFASSQNGVSWSVSNEYNGATVAISTDQAYAGSRSLRFRYPAQASGVDCGPEKRMAFGGRTAVWLRFRMRVPTNYIHRNDSPNNNKFLAIYRAPYDPPSLHVNFSTSRVSDTTSKVSAHTFLNGVEQSIINGGNLIESSDFGVWRTIVMQFEASSSIGAADGVMKMWKDGASIFNRTNLPLGKTGSTHSFNELYVMGWSNSGFSAQTDIFIDNFEFADSNIFGVS